MYNAETRKQYEKLLKTAMESLAPRYGVKLPAPKKSKDKRDA